MYNRYVPQSDGSFQRCRIGDPPQPEPPCKEPVHHTPEPEACPPPPVQKQQRRHPRPPVQPPRQEKYQEPRSGNILHFLRNMLPKDFDTGDLLVVLLLLLMSGDCQEEPNTALLTLALYLFM